MSGIFTKILACIYGGSNDGAVLEGAANFCRAFGAKLVIGATEEGSRNSANIISEYATALPVPAEKLTLANENFKTVAKAVDDIGADLVVLTNSKENQHLVNALKIPVLSILKDFKKGQIRNILMPIHDDPGTRQKIPLATEISKVFNATVNILVVAGNSKEEITKLKTYAYQAEKYIHEKGGKCVYHIETGKKVVEETIRIAQESGADLVVIMNDREGGGWFSKAKSELIMDGCNVPVLVVEPKETTISFAQL